MEIQIAKNVCVWGGGAVGGLTQTLMMEGGGDVKKFIFDFDGISNFFFCFDVLIFSFVLYILDVLIFSFVFTLFWEFLILMDLLIVSFVLIFYTFFGSQGEIRAGTKR